MILAKDTKYCQSWAHKQHSFQIYKERNISRLTDPGSTSKFAETLQLDLDQLTYNAMDGLDAIGYLCDVAENASELFPLQMELRHEEMEKAGDEKRKTSR